MRIKIARHCFHKVEVGTRVEISLQFPRMCRSPVDPKQALLV